MTRNRNSGNVLLNVLDTLALIMWGPKTGQQIADISGRSLDTVYGHLRALRASGLIYESGHDTACSNVRKIWTAQAMPFAKPDMPYQKRPRKRSAQPVCPPKQQPASSVFALADSLVPSGA